MLKFCGARQSPKSYNCVDIHPFNSDTSPTQHLFAVQKHFLLFFIILTASFVLLIMPNHQTISFYDITDLKNNVKALDDFARRFGLLPALDQTLNCDRCEGNSTSQIPGAEFKAEKGRGWSSPLSAGLGARRPQSLLNRWGRNKRAATRRVTGLYLSTAADKAS